MKVLTQPGAVAVLACLLAAGVHPRFPLGASEGFAIGVAAVALLLACAYAVRALRSGWGERVMALGAAALVVGLAIDGARAHRGVVRLVLGQAKNNFEERGAAGRSLGLRPLRAEIQLVRAGGTEATLALSGGREVTITPSRSAEVGSFRMGQPHLHPTGEASRLTVTVTDGSGPAHTVELGADQAGRVGDLEIELERYFPDFALDERQQPFSRSVHSRNPAALLRVRRGERTHRVFVIRSMPGLHQVEELGRSFELAAVVPELSVALEVAEEPAAPLLAVGALALLAAVALGRSSI